MVDTPNYATVSATGAAGLRVGTTSRGANAASPAGSFLSLLLQGQSASPDDAPADVPLSLTAGSGADPQTITTKTFSSALSLASAVSEAISKRKKTSTETGADPLVLVTPALDSSKAAHWFLSLTGVQASTTVSTSSLSSDLCAQHAGSSTGSSGDALTTAGSTQEGKAEAVSGLPADVILACDSAVNLAADGVTQGTADAVPCAELSLTSLAAPSDATRVTAVLSSATCTPAPKVASAAARNVPETDPQLQRVADSPASPKIDMKSFTPESESSFDPPSNGQKETLVVSKKKAESDSTQSGDVASPSNRGSADSGLVPRELTTTSAPLSTESDEPSNKAEASPAMSTVYGPTNAETAKPAGAAVGTIELQVKSADDSSVGLRFVERQGRVEVQLKSGDQQTAQALTESLSGLKTSLNESGWDVQTRVPSAGRATEVTALDQRIHSATEQPSSLQVIRTGDASSSQMNQQGRSDSSANQDRSGPERDDSSGRNGQQGRQNNASADSERQGRRSTQDSEAWLESMESNLTRSSTGRVTNGVTK